MATEKRLIDANALQNLLLPIAIGLEKEYGSLGGAVSGVMMHVDDAPTVDAVEVVRCSDCKHWIKADRGSWQMRGRTDGTCKMLAGQHCAEMYMTEHDHFCAYGERR